jgi:HAE1 family hydrophobic/amphiphilic exporter-1
MEKIVRWCLKNRSVVFLATVILIASGVYATTRLNQELLPDIEFPVITVSTPVPGAGPDVVDEQVTQPIESAVDDVEGLESIQSTSSAGFSVLVIEFALDADTKEAEAELVSALDGVALPQQAEEPEVQSLSASGFPIMSVSLSAKDGDLAELTDYARDEAVPLIEEVEGVARTDLVGGAERQIGVELDTEKLKENELSADAVVGAISGAAGVNTPVGEVEIDGLSTPCAPPAGSPTPPPSKTCPSASVEELRPGCKSPRGRRPVCPVRYREELRRACRRLGLLRVALRSRSCSVTLRRCGRSLRTSPASRGPTASRASASM